MCYMKKYCRSCNTGTKVQKYLRCDKGFWGGHIIWVLATFGIWLLFFPIWFFQKPYRRCNVCKCEYDA